MRYGVVAHLRALVIALGIVGASLAMLAGAASAETFNASNTQQLVEAVSKANAKTGANTIVLTGGAYLPEATLTFTNTTGLQTVEGPSALPTAKLEGTNVTPFPSELFVLNAGVSVTFKNVEVAHGGGAGAAAIDDFGTLGVENSTVSGNTGVGVHVESGGTATVRNSTLSDGIGFGMVDHGTASFFNSTVAFNGEPGIENSGTLSLTNTIVAKNTGSDCVGKANTSDHSLDSDGSCGVGALSKMDPLLGNLLNNGGSTPTHALQKGSPAIDAADSAACLATDQRHFTRPDLPSTACDVGAYEFYVPAHWYKNGTISAEGAKLRTIEWGNVKFTNMTLGEVVCHTISAGYAENPTGGGAGVGQLQASFPYECVDASCIPKVQVTPEKLPWNTELTEPESGVFRNKTGKRGNETGSVFFTVNCEGVAKPQFVGERAPKILNDGISIGSSPDEEEFDQPGSGELENETSGGLKLAGKVKVESYSAEDLVEVKIP